MEDLNSWRPLSESWFVSVIFDVSLCGPDGEDYRSLFIAGFCSPEYVQTNLSHFTYGRTMVKLTFDWSVLEREVSLTIESRRAESWIDLAREIDHIAASELELDLFLNPELP
jgi:hypothetical protein